MAESRSLNNFSVRILTAIALGLVFLILLHLGGIVLLLMVLIIGMLGLREFLILSVRPLTPLYLLGCLLILNLIYIAHYNQIVFPWGLALSLWLCYAITDALVFGGDLPASERLKRITAGFSGIVLLGLLGYLIPFQLVGNRITAMDVSFANPVLLIPMCGAWGYDTGGLFTGKILGHTPFASGMSPRKTWEGLAGGLLSAIVALLLVRALFFKPEEVTPVLSWVLVASALGLCAQFGDLFVSVLKREAGVKNSGSLVPGHGGVLDRLDSFLVVLPVAYFLLPYLFKDISYFQLVGV
ncbi:MAG: phosphatidate cytidylyltransferase [bacterium JZ-2024 1]